MTPEHPRSRRSHRRDEPMTVVISQPILSLTGPTALADICQIAFIPLLSLFFTASRLHMICNMRLAFAAIMVLGIAGIIAPLPSVGQDQTIAQTLATLSVNPGGMQRQVPGRWAILSVNGTNPTERDTEETVSVTMGNHKDIQYARRIWIPAGGSRKGWLPVWCPDDIEPGQLLMDMHSIHLRESRGVESFQSNVVGMPVSQRSLMVSTDESRAVAVFHSPSIKDALANERVQDIANMINKGRDRTISANQQLGVIHFSEDFLPPSPVGLDSIDQFIIASDRIFNDSAAIDQLQRWVGSGGILWVMVDQLNSQNLRSLLGDEASFQEVDRVELNDFTMETVVSAASGGETTRETWSSETPVDMVRGFTVSAEVVCQVDGWPAAFVKPYGDGMIFFTTLGGPGWLKNNDRTLAYQTLSQRIFSPRVKTIQPTAELASFADNTIGYSIPSRTIVAIIFALHLVVVIGAGTWLAYGKRAQQLAMLIPGAALITALSFLILGKSQTAAVPSSIVTTQIVRNIPHSREANVHSVAAIYSDQSRPLVIESSPNTMTSLRDGALDGNAKRLLWDDTGRSQWLFVTQPPGVVRHLQSDSVITLESPWKVTGTFTPQGFEGQLAGLDGSRVEDMLILANPAPSLALNQSQSSPGLWIGGRDDILATGQYVHSEIISDIQRDRQKLIRQILNAEKPLFGTGPVALLWTDSIDSGITFDKDFVRQGSALASVPIEIKGTASGSEFSVPASFIRIEPYLGERGRSTIFDPRTGRWIEMNKPAEADLRCVLPPQLLPCRLSRAHLTIKLSAPSRTFAVKALIDGQFTTVHTKQDPTGVLALDIEDPNALQLDAEGGLVLSLSISPSEEELKASAEVKSGDQLVEPSRSAWQIEYLHVEVQGTKL